MKKDDIKDAAVITASAVLGSQIGSALEEMAEIVSVDPVPCVYGPPPAIIEDDQMQVDDDLVQVDDNDNILPDPEGYDDDPIDDVLCVYGPPPGII